MTNPKIESEGREILQTVRDCQLDDIEAETRLLLRKHSTTSSNEVLAAIAVDSFCDACEAWDIPGGFAAFQERFPVLAECY